MDTVQYRNFILVWHLKDWSLCGKDGKKIELTFEEQGCLSDKSLKQVLSISPSIMDTVLSIFEKDMLLA